MEWHIKLVFSEEVTKKEIIEVMEFRIELIGEPGTVSARLSMYA